MPQREQFYRERAVAPAQSGSRRRRVPEGFTYISACVKYTMFFFNFLFWMCGLLLIAVGVYATLDKWSNGEVFNLKTIYDVMFNIGFLFIIIGGVVCIVSFAGCIGSLRENMFLLKFYSFCLLIFFLAEMTLMALAFIYPHKLTEFLENELSEKLIASYRDDLDFQNLIDLVQQDFECCGISSNGYRDWSKNEYFNCTTKEDNPSVERCGVPYSCCLKEPSDVLVNFMCGFQVQEMKEVEDVVRKINTTGCIPAIQAIIQSNLYPVGGIAIGIALSQLFVIWLSRTLEGQIESQKSLWTIQ
jgi:tetraspanin-33